MFQVLGHWCCVEVEAKEFASGTKRMCIESLLKSLCVELMVVGKSYE